MSLLDIIKKLFTNNKTNTHIYCEDLNKIKGETTPLSIILLDKNGNLLADKPVDIEINNVKYTKITDENGIARLNINLNVGSYPVGVSFRGDEDYNKSTGYCKVHVNPKIIVQDLKMEYKDGSKFTARLTDNDNNPLQDTNVVFKINGASYNRVTDNDGVASLNINLNPGDYNILTSIAGVTLSNNVHIDKIATHMEGIDLTKQYGDTTPYQCAVYAGNSRVAGSVDLKINGKTYTRTADENGLYKLNINLNPGTYDIVCMFHGDVNYAASSIKNTIVIKEAPAPTPEPAPVKLYNYLTTPGGGKLGQKTGYSCGPHSLMQAIYRLTGIELSESELMSACGTTSSGTGHSGLETGLAWFNRKYGYKLKMTWKNKSDLSWDEIQKLMNTGAVFFHLLYRNQWGHYEIAKNTNCEVLNSLGSYCSYPSYCGYIENRSRATQQSYINGISQKSVCIITM